MYNSYIFVIISSGERWRVQLIGEYPNYINAVFIPVRIMHFLIVASTPYAY